MSETIIDDIVELLEIAGYGVVVGAEATIEKMFELAPKVSMPLCSGYRVFPDSTKCGGCPDCNKEVEK